MNLSSTYEDPDPAAPLSARSRTVADARAAVIAVGTILGAVAFVGFLMWHAPYEPGEVVPYEQMLRVRDGWWFSHYFGGTAMGLGFVALALAAALVVRRGAGSQLVTWGAVLTLFGGVTMGPGLAGEGVAYSYATDQRAVAAQPGAELLQYMFEYPDRYLILLLVGLAAVTIGCLLISAGLWRSRTVPRWIPVALAVGTVVMMVAPHAIAWWASLPRTVAAVAVGTYAWMASRRTDA